MKYARLKPGAGFRPLHSMLYYLQRIVVQRQLRGMCIGAGRTWVRARRGRGPGPAEADGAALTTLRSDGYAPLGQLLTSQQCTDIKTYLASKVMTDRVDDTTTFTLATRPEGTRMGDYGLSDLLHCPHILELANHPALLSLASAYIGCTPTISQLGMRWSFPNTTRKNILQKFHRDSEDWRYFKVLVYLTDVGPGEGPHVFVRGTHLEQASVRLHAYEDDAVENRYGKDNVMPAMGSAGFGFAVDTAGIHKGLPPTENPRLMLQIQYSLSPCFAYEYMPEAYHGHLALDPYINRLIVRTRAPVDEPQRAAA